MIKLYNTLLHKKQNFKSPKNEVVKIYACGPTVYDFAHIGNLRTYVFEDILRRTLKYNGYKIKQAMNITDVEDKIIKKSKIEKKDIFEITKPYTKNFFEDLKKLNIEKVEFYPKATEYVKEMIVLVKKLIDKKFAYQGEDGSVYFNISKFKNYGKLSRLEKRNLRPCQQKEKIRSQINTDEYKKEEAQDFVLWKTLKTKPAQIKIKNFTTINNEPAWQSPWGWGRPGWHIECSAMSAKILGETLDIHAGAVDLIFPHHENEIAQSEAVTGKKLTKYWIHGEHLLVNGKKMSKSLGNFFTLQDIENKKVDPLAFRYLILTTHYRSKLNFTWRSLEAAQNALNNLTEALKEKTDDKKAKTRNNELEKYKKEFLSAINDDLNTPKTLSIVWKIIKNKNLSSIDKKRLIFKFDEVLGLKLKRTKSSKIPEKIRKLAIQREKLRVNKQFIQADALRKQIEQLGYTIEDTNYEPKITPARH